jgi:DNA-binding PadR family transcriptional regulator
MAETIAVSTTEGAVLGLLAFGERSGYDLARLAEESVAHIWTPSRSQIYKVLPRLVAAGLAQTRAVEQQRRPDKALYRLTASGRRALRSWLDEVEDEPAGGRVVFPLKVLFCDFASPATALAQLTAYRGWLTRRLEQYERLEPEARASRYRYPNHALKHGLTRVRATLDWIDETVAALGRDNATPAGGRSRPASAPTAARPAAGSSRARRRG